jgi:hypothetical protein
MLAIESQNQPHRHALQEMAKRSSHASAKQKQESKTERESERASERANHRNYRDIINKSTIMASRSGRPSARPPPWRRLLCVPTQTQTQHRKAVAELAAVGYRVQVLVWYDCFA